jgi:hypothetical protein
MPRAKKDPSKKNPATAQVIMMAVASGGAIAPLKDKYKITYGPAKQALDMILTFNPKAKIDELKALVAELEHTGGTSPRGRIPAKVGDTRTYKITNYNATKKVKVSPSCVIPLAMYEAAGQEGAALEITFKPNGQIVGKLTAWTEEEETQAAAE